MTGPRFLRRRPPQAALTSAAALLLLLLLPCAAAAAEEAVGQVTRLQGEASLERGGAAGPLSQGTSLLAGDVVVSAAEARLEIALADGSTLTLGGQTRFAFDEFDYRPQAGAGRALFRMSSGAFRLVTQGLGRLGDATVQVQTPLATIGVRGTDVWGGRLPIGRFGVLMIEGTGVVITNAAGTVEIASPGLGVWVKSADAALPAPAPWTAEEAAMAVGAVTFRP